MTAPGGPEVIVTEPASWRPPMLAQPVRRSAPLPPGEWCLERKLDGLRCVAVRNGADLALWSRGHQPYTARFGHIARQLVALAAENFVLDGEIVAFDERGRTSFSLLQRPSPSTRPVFVAFDLLHLLGHPTVALAMVDRRRLLAQVLEPSPVLDLVEQVDPDPDPGHRPDPDPDPRRHPGHLGDGGGWAGHALGRACAQGWEGLVAKRAGSPYTSGRSADWRKLKCNASQELVIGGWTEARGRRPGFGALLVGYYHRSGGRGLRFAGRVGTGFDDVTLGALHAELTALELDEPPFTDSLSAADVGVAPHWAAPSLVAAVEFTEWTLDGRLRHPRFAGLRRDKAATEVVRETS